LKNPLVQKRIDFFKNNNAFDDGDDPQLLQTIKVPKNMLFLTEKLPKPNYEKIPQKRNLSFTNNETDMVKKKKQIKKNIEKELRAENLDGSYLQNVHEGGPKDHRNHPNSNPNLNNIHLTKQESIDVQQPPQPKKKKNEINPVNSINSSLLDNNINVYSERKLPSIDNKYALPSINSSENRNNINRGSSNNLNEATTV
jgi:hypothetical protein